MSLPEDLSVKSFRVINVLSPELAGKIRDYEFRLGAIHSGYPNLPDWQGTLPDDWGLFEQLPFQRSVVYRGNAQSWGYSHHQTVVKFGDKYVMSWTNGLADEDFPGQEVHYACSNDCVRWSEPQVLVHTPVESGLVRNNAGLYAADGRLYCYVGVAENRQAGEQDPNMQTLKQPRMQLDVYETSDLKNWTHYEAINNKIYLFEGPRPMRSGKLMCCGSDPNDNHAIVLIWDDPSRPTDAPRAVDIAESTDGVLPEQGTWYQTDDGRIWLYHRDTGISGYLGLTVSDDEGDTWSDLVRTDFPNSFSRAFAGRLTDGRYYIVGNNYNRFLDRMGLLIAVSDDGRSFDRQYTLVTGPTTRRVPGFHKEDGWHYPNCFVDGDKLLVCYSVNKEDIELGVVDMSKVK